MEKMNILLEFIKRMKSESPDFFKKLQKYSWVVFVISGAAWLLKVFGVYEIPVELDAALSKLIEYLTVGGLVSGVVSSTPVKSKEAAGVPDDTDLVGGRPDDRK